MTRPRLRQFTVLALVLAVHLLFLLVASRGRRSEAPVPEPEAMILLYLPPAVEVPQTQQRRAPRAVARANTTQSPQLPHSEAAPTAITPEPAPEPAQSAIDWHREAQIAVDAQAKQGIREQRQECEEAARKHNAPPPGCPKASYDPHWSPEEKKAGFIGIIPYVRLGKRCIVGLWFFGCNTDAKLPEPRGDLLNNMTDPSRPASSVPELDNTTPEAPSPQAVRPQ